MVGICGDLLSHVCRYHHLGRKEGWVCKETVFLEQNQRPGNKIKQDLNAFSDDTDRLSSLQ